MLRRCCCCVPLRVGCTLIGIILMIVAVANLSEDAKAISYIENEDNDDEENLEQKKRIRPLYYFWVSYETVLLLTGVLIVIASCKTSPCMLKGCACILVVLAFAPGVRLVVFGVGVTFTKLAKPLSTLVVLLYAAYVLWSYVKELLNPTDEEVRQNGYSMSTVYRNQPTTNPSNYLAGYPIPSHYPPGYYGPAGQIGGQTVYIAPPGHPGHPSPSGVSPGYSQQAPGEGPVVTESSSSIDGNHPRSARPTGYPGEYPQQPNAGYPGVPGWYPQGPNPGYPLAPGGYPGSTPQGPNPGYPLTPRGYPGSTPQGWNSNPQQPQRPNDPMQFARGSLGAGSMFNQFGRH